MFKPGNAIIFAHELYFVESGNATSGQVRDCGGQSISPFYWTFEGETCRLATKEELAKARRHNPQDVDKALALI